MLSNSWAVKRGVSILSFFVILFSGTACAAPLLEKDLFTLKSSCAIVARQA